MENLDMKEAEAFEIVASSIASEYSKLDDGTLGLRIGLEAESYLGQIGFRVFAWWIENYQCHRVVGSRIALRDFTAFKFQIDITHLLRDVSRAVEDKRCKLANERNGLHKTHTD